MRNYKCFLLMLILVVTFSCDHDDSPPNTCDVGNPSEELPWLKSMIESWKVNSTIYSYMYIQQGTYLRQTVFIVGNCCPFCDSYFPVFNCEGEELEGINLQDITDQKNIWRPVGSQCTF